MKPRLVLIHANGTYQIQGIFDNTKKTIKSEVENNGERALLVKVTPRMILYRQVK